VQGLESKPNLAQIQRRQLCDLHFSHRWLWVELRSQPEQDKLSFKDNGIATILNNNRKTLTLPGINASDLSGAPGGLRPAGPVSGDAQPKPVRRCAVYFDGFNFFHALEAFGKWSDPATRERHLKWINLWKLSEQIVRPPRDQLVKVVWCSAPYTKDPGKLVRHRAYKKALEAVGAVPVLGRFISEPVHHPETDNLLFIKQTEKTSDVSLALHLMLDAVDNVYDDAYLVTADTDQAATGKMFKARFAASGKQIFAVAPLGHRHQQDLIDNTDGDRSVTEEMVRTSLFGSAVYNRAGKWVVDRPQQYQPPVIAMNASVKAKPGVV
jgi:hypothetical protein